MEQQVGGLVAELPLCKYSGEEAFNRHESSV